MRSPFQGVLQAFIVDGDTEGFNQIAHNESNPELRKKAIEGLGINGDIKAFKTYVDSKGLTNYIAEKVEFDPGRPAHRRLRSRPFPPGTLDRRPFGRPLRDANQRRAGWPWRLPARAPTNPDVRG